tara:strand:- start:93 stop:239 length:147 start_codon:yes stop_codon:yes gene_type:complete
MIADVRDRFLSLADLANDVNIFSSPGERLRVGLSVPTFDYLRAAHTET